VRARDDDRFTAFQEFFADESGHGGERDALIEDALHFRIAAGECVADDDEVRRRIEV